MYSINVESQDAHRPVINRCMSANKAIEMLPIVIEICRAEFDIVNPVALYMGDGVYRVFDIENPSEYAEITIIKDCN